MFFFYIPNRLFNPNMPQIIFFSESYSECSLSMRMHYLIQINQNNEDF